ncbi:ATP-binding protein, partial [Paracoccus siganidrum]
HWSALTPDRPLLRWQLLRAGHAPLMADAPLMLEPRLLHALMGAGSADSVLEPWGRRLGAPQPLSAAQRAVAAELAQLLGRQPVQLIGPRTGDRDAVLRCAGAGRSLWRLDAIPADPAALLQLARLIERESVLTGMIPVLDAGSEPARRLALALDAAFVLTGTEAWHGLDRPARTLALPPTDFAARRELWRAAAPDAAPEGLDRLANDFALDALAIAEIGAACDGTGQMRDMARLRCRVPLDGLAARRRPLTEWDDLALRPAQRAALQALAERVRRQPRVLHDWGYARASGRGNGTVALFTGPSGTGKTLASEAVAAALDLDLLHVDLGQVVSKWLGETEKNLDRIFDAAAQGGAVLLFDEADALFGKRGEVRDSRDRHANMEISFLLQRIEAHDGLVILTTNQQQALDDAFLRRIAVIVQFPFPDAELRRDIWTRSHPAAAPVLGLDAGRLAQIAVSGGEIRNIALGAAFGAAGREADAIGMDDLLAAADRELAKLGRPRSGRKDGGQR